MNTENKLIPCICYTHTHTHTHIYTYTEKNREGQFHVMHNSSRKDIEADKKYFASNLSAGQRQQKIKV